jgi:Domain of unknown function (DUF4936)
MRELFIYYRLEPANQDAAHAAVLAFQQRLRAQHPGLRTRLLRRPDRTDGPETWMETYAADPVLDPSGITPETQAHIEHHAKVIEPFIQGARQVEVFVACVS